MPKSAFRKEATRPSPPQDRRLWYAGQAEAYAYLVARGELAAWFLVPRVYLPDIRGAIVGHRCTCRVGDQTRTLPGTQIAATPAQAPTREASDLAAYCASHHHHGRMRRGEPQ